MRPLWDQQVHISSGTIKNVRISCSPTNSLGKDSTPTVPVLPEWAFGTTLSLRVIDFFFVRASYDSVGHNNALGTPFLQEGIYTERCISSFAQVKAITGSPTFHHSDIFGLILQAGYDNFRGSFIVWAVEGNSNYRIPTKSLSCSLPNAVPRSFLFKVQHRVKAVPASLVVQ